MNKLAMRLLIAGMLLSGIFTPVLFAKSEQAEVWQKQTVTVLNGDTVWAIARQFAAKDEDIRMVVARIYKENNLGGRAVIQPGQQLVVPVKTKEVATVN